MKKSETKSSKLLTIMEKALSMKEGEQVVLPCSSRNERNSLRTLLFNCKKKMNLAVPGMCDSLKIKVGSYEETGQFYVSIIKDTGGDIPVAYLLQKDGSNIKLEDFLPKGKEDRNVAKILEEMEAVNE